MDSLDKIVSEIRGFAEERDWEKFHTPQNLAVSIIIEVAELLELFQWTFNRVEGSPSFPEKSRIGEELADVVIYCLRLADIEGIDLIKEIKKKLQNNRKKYPSNKYKGIAVRAKEAKK